MEEALGAAGDQTTKWNGDITVVRKELAAVKKAL